MSKDYRIHTLAGLFPRMSGDEYRHLRDDIRSHGLREPITLLEMFARTARKGWKAWGSDV